MTVTTTIDGAVGELVLARPEARNALDLDFVRALHAGITRLREAEVSVVLLRAEGPAFCVGGDLRAFAAADDLADYVLQVATVLHESLVALWELPAVVVSMVQGVAAGGGFPLALCGDLVVASTAARFDLAYVRAGLTPDGGSSILVASLGLHRALQVALLSPALSAEQVRELGLVLEVVEPDALEARARELVAQLAAGPHQAQAQTRRLLRARAVPDPVGALAQETAAIVAQVAGPEGREGIAAFLEKRAPRF